MPLSQMFEIHSNIWHNGIAGEVLYKCTGCDAERTETITATAADVSIWINNLPETPGAADEDTIADVRAAYEALDEGQKALIDNNTLARLSEAETRVADAKATEARAEQDRKAASKVTDLINNLPSVLTSSDEKAVNDVLEALTKLTPDQALLIPETDRIKAQNAGKSMQAIKAIENMDPDDSASVEAARKTYDALTDQQKKMLAATSLDKLKKAEAGLKTKPVQVNSIKLIGISKKVVRGKMIKLTATVLPINAANKKLSWTTSNKKLATVTQAGVVKIAKKAKPGKAVTIMAKAEDGSGKKAIWKIKVMKGAVKKITVKGYKKTLKAGKTMKLKAVVKVTKGKPVNKKLKWTSSNPKYATVTQSGKVKALKAAKGKTVKIKVMSTDGTNKSVIKSIKIK